MVTIDEGGFFEMTKKSLKIFLILLVIFSLCTICSSAANINLNLPGTDNTQSNNSVNSEEPINNQTASNQVTDNNTTNNSDITDANATDSNNIVDNNDTTIPDNPLDDMQTLQPTTNESSNSGLSVTNIINILLITVGVILILLAIAIMIRLK